MKVSRRYLVAVALLAITAVIFGIVGTVAPPLAEETTSNGHQQLSTSGTVGHFEYPPTYDSGWVDIKSKTGQYFSLTHNLNTTEVVVDITGKQSLNDFGGEHQRNLGGTDIVLGANYTYGGTGSSLAYSVTRASDGAYMIAGTHDGDFNLIKASSNGDLLWSRTYGGTGFEETHSVVETADHGFALAGYTNSFGAGSWDAWLVRTDSSGNQLWNKTYGGTGEDRIYGMIPAWGGFVLAGHTNSFGAGGIDGWLIVTYGDGNVWWSQTYGGRGDDIVFSVAMKQIGPTGFVLAGYTNSYGAGTNDAWLVKTDVLGNMQWNRTYGETFNDQAECVIETSDGSILLTGYTDSFGAGNSDFWLIKVNWMGSTVWTKTYGGPNTDRAHCVIQTSDGYAIVGETASYGAGNLDFWLVKTDSNGDVQWSRTYGKSGNEFAYSLTQNQDGSYMLVGYPSPHSVIMDVWMVRTDADFDVGLAWIGTTDKRITLFRGRADPYWNYVRVRMWLVQEPTWMYGDINQDGKVDAKDLYIIGRNYGKTFSLLSLGGIAAIAGIRINRNRKQNKQPSNTN